MQVLFAAHNRGFGKGFIVRTIITSITFTSLYLQRWYLLCNRDQTHLPRIDMQQAVFSAMRGLVYDYQGP